MTEPNEGLVAPSGALGLAVVRDGVVREIPDGGDWPTQDWLGFGDLRRVAGPQAGLPDEVNEWRERNFLRVAAQWSRIGLAKAFARRAGLMTGYGRLFLRVFRADGEVLDLGLASMQMITTTGVGFLVDAIQNLVEPELLKFHGIGTGAGAEATSETALVTELTTQYNPDNTRATGTLAEASATVFRTVGTNTVDAGASIIEHGILTQAATGGGVLLDRSLFSVVTLASGDGLQSTYDLTLAAGG